MRTRWILSCALGETLGIAAVAVAFAAVSRGLVPSAPSILGAGAWEGLCLGTAQALVLRSLGVRRGAWIAATVLIATIGYGGALAMGAGGVDTGQGAAEPPFGLVLMGAAAMGAGMGLMMGAVQWLAARTILPPGRWVLGNMIGWTPAMIAIFVPATLVGATTPLFEVAALGAASGAVAGLCVGLATAPVLPAHIGAHA